MIKKNWNSTEAQSIKPYADFAIEMLHTGSRVICQPPVMDTDDDWLFLCDLSIVKSFEQQLVKDGFKAGGSLTRTTEYRGKPYLVSANGYVKEIDPSKETQLPELITWPTEEDYKRDRQEKDGKLFHSWKRDQLNIIITASSELFENFFKATTLCKALNLTDKEARIIVFEAIKFDKWPSYNHLIYTRDSEGYMTI